MIKVALNLEEFLHLCKTSAKSANVHPQDLFTAHWSADVEVAWKMAGKPAPGVVKVQTTAAEARRQMSRELARNFQPSMNKQFNVSVPFSQEMTQHLAMLLKD